jgi:DNA-binding LytR/AlgR family response regulator
MHSEIKIGIVEDELIIAEKIKRILLTMGYLVCEPVSLYDEALEMIVNEKPDLLLLDINLNDKKDGIDLAEKINHLYQLPFIFLTANSDSATIDRAKKVKPGAFLVKPFNKEELFASIEITFNNYTDSRKVNTNLITTLEKVKDFIFVKENHRYIKLLFNEIVYVESCENYVVVHNQDKKSAIVRSTFNDFLAQLPSAQFIRTHRGYAVQFIFIDNVEPTEVTAKGYKIPISNTYRGPLYTLLGISYQ